MERYVGLVRVSTERQGESRLGLEAGLADITAYIARNGGTLLEILEEVESGTHDELTDRPTLVKALRLCKRQRAILLVPKVDRLVRSTMAYSEIKRSGTSFRACDNPTANEFTLDILVAVAAQEARAIADRVRRALAAYKAGKRVSKATLLKYPQGVPQDIVDATAGKLGSDLVGCHLTAEDRDRGRRRANRKQRAAAVDVYADLVADMLKWRAEGVSLRAIAERLNAEGPTRTGAAWTHKQVSRSIERVVYAEPIRPGNARPTTDPQ